MKVVTIVNSIGRTVYSNQPDDDDDYNEEDAGLFFFFFCFFVSFVFLYSSVCFCLLITYVIAAKVAAPVVLPTPGFHVHHIMFLGNTKETIIKYKSICLYNLRRNILTAPFIHFWYPGLYIFDRTHQPFLLIPSRFLHKTQSPWPFRSTITAPAHRYYLFHRHLFLRLGETTFEHKNSILGEYKLGEQRIII